MTSRPLIVDLDGTLVNTDMLHELAVKLFSEKPWLAMRFPIELRKGRARLKQYISANTNFDAALLPYNEPFLAWLKEQKTSGRQLVLCTAADASIAEPIAQHLGIFDQVMASDGQLNLSGERKAAALVSKFGLRGFDYCGNANIDLVVWAKAHSAVAVNATAKLLQNAQALLPVAASFSSPRRPRSVVMRMTSHYRWLWVTLAAIVLAVILPSATLSKAASAGVIAFCVLAGLPMMSDLLRIDKHRRVLGKETLSRKPVANGEVPIVYAVIAVLCLTTAALVALLVLVF